MSVKILTVGDLHCKSDNINNVVSLTNQLKEILINENPDALVFLGDQLNDHSRIDSDSFSTLTTCLQELLPLTPELIILVGNHCLVNNNLFLSNRHPYNSFKLWPKTTIVDDVITKEINGQKFLFSCYVPNNRFMEALETKNLKIPLEGYTAVFAHHEFTGTDINNITKSKTDTWPDEAPYMISGHLHSYQQPQKNLYYPGVPFQHSFNDSLLRTISTFKFSKEEEVIEKRIELDIEKKFTLHLTVEELSKYELPSNCTVKLKVKGEISEIREVRKLKNVVNLEKSGKVKIVEINESKKDKEKVILNSFKIKTPFIKRVHKKIRKEEDEIKEIFNDLFDTNL